MQDVKDAALRMKARSVPGADGWRVKELRRLRHGFYVDLTNLFNHLESSGRVWPSALRTAWIAAVPKKTSTLDSIRPIAVLPVFIQDLECHTWAGSSEDG